MASSSKNEKNKKNESTVLAREQASLGEFVEAAELNNRSLENTNVKPKPHIEIIEVKVDYSRTSKGEYKKIWVVADTPINPPNQLIVVAEDEVQAAIAVFTAEHLRIQSNELYVSDGNGTGLAIKVRLNPESTCVEQISKSIRVKEKSSSSSSKQFHKYSYVKVSTSASSFSSITSDVRIYSDSYYILPQ